MSGYTVRIKKLAFALIILLLAAVVGVVYVGYLKPRIENKVRIIIIDGNGGRLGNSLWHFSYMYAYCLEKGYELSFPRFSREYGSAFASFTKNASGSPTSGSLLDYLPDALGKKCYWYLIKKILPLVPGFVKVRSLGQSIPMTPTVPGEEYGGYRMHVISDQVNSSEFSVNRDIVKLEDSGFVKGFKSGYYGFHGWGFYSEYALARHSASIIEFFRPTKEIQSRIDSFWIHLDSESLIIGVHIRRTDFKNIPEHFFSVSEYKSRMSELFVRYSRFNPLFVIYSDEALALDDFEGLPCVLSAGGTVDDLFSMARCDLIVGSGYSTYSAWAAWCGASEKVWMEKTADWALIDGAVENKMNSKTISF